MQYENCLRKFFYNTDSQVLLYLARTHYEAEQWQECKKTLLRAIHLAPSNYTLRFDAGVTLQKFSASTLQKTKRTVDEVIFFSLLFSVYFMWVLLFLFFIFILGVALFLFSLQINKFVIHLAFGISKSSHAMIESSIVFLA